MIHHNDNNIDWEPYKTKIHINSTHPSIKVQSQNEIKKHLGGIVNKTPIVPIPTTKELLDQFYHFKHHYIKLNKLNSFVTTKKNINICVRCHQKGGTFFTTKNGKYHARCGNKNPCFEFIFTTSQEIDSIEQNLIQLKKIEQIQKETIIKQKMETMFGYKDFSISVKEFKKQIPCILQEDLKLGQIEKEYQNVTKNENKQHLIEEQKIQIQIELNNLKQLSLSGTKQNIDDIVNVNNRITDLYIELRKLTYILMEIEIHTKEDDNVSILVQKMNHLRDKQIGTESTVDKYFIKNFKNEITTDKETNF